MVIQPILTPLSFSMNKHLALEILQIKGEIPKITKAKRHPLRSAFSFPLKSIYIFNQPSFSKSND